MIRCVLLAGRAPLPRRARCPALRRSRPLAPGRPPMLRRIGLRRGARSSICPGRTAGARRGCGSRRSVGCSGLRRGARGSIRPGRTAGARRGCGSRRSIGCIGLRRGARSRIRFGRAAGGRRGCGSRRSVGPAGKGGRIGPVRHDFISPPGTVQRIAPRARRDRRRSQRIHVAAVLAHGDRTVHELHFSGTRPSPSVAV